MMSVQTSQLSFAKNFEDRKGTIRLQATDQDCPSQDGRLENCLEDEPHSCEYCKRLVVDLFRPDAWKESRQGLERSRPDTREIYLFDFTLADLCTASNEGCVLCQWILNDPWSTADGKLLSLSSQMQTRSGATTNHELEEPKDLTLYARLEIIEDCDISSIKCFGLHSTKNNLTVTESRHGFNVYAHFDDAAGNHISTRPISIYPGSQSNFHRARTWLKDCCESHEKCQRPASTFMPARLLEIVQQEREPYLRLYDCASHGQQPYAALSYCWGGDQSLQTSRETLQDHLTAISWKEIPKTIQDALIVAQELGLRFLWVDSLCTVQDDPMEVTSEIARMSEIFGQATITIAAVRASHVDEGFLGPRKISTHHESLATLPYRCVTGHIGSIFLLRLDCDELSEPLDQRAWTMQERLLSQRVLEFGTRQSRWYCQSNQNQAGYTDGWSKDPHVDPAREENRLELKHFDAQNPSMDSTAADDAIMDRFVREWQCLVAAYTRRGLSVSTDRILAISGFAKRFSKVIRSDYLAGIWKSTLPYGLCWAATSGSPGSCLRSRPETYHGPSWSWTSIIDPIKHYSGFGSVESKIEIIDCRISLVDEIAPFGAVRAGELKIKGRLRAAYWIHDSGENDCDELRLQNVDGLEAGLAVSMQADALEPEWANKNVSHLPVYLLEIFRRSGPNDFGSTGIVLRTLGDSYFSRLGIFDLKATCSGRSRSPWSGDGRTKLNDRYERLFEGADYQLVTII